MPRPIPDIMPDTLAGWNQMCEDILFNAQEAFDLACNEAREKAAAAFDAEAPARRQALLDQAKAQIDAQLDQEGQPLADSEKAALLAEAAKQIDAELASQREEAVNNSSIGIEQPQTLEQIKTTYGYGKPQEQQPEPEQPKNQGFSYDSFYRLADGRLYSVADAQFVTARSAAPDAIDVPGGTEADLKILLQWYKENGYPKVVIGDELLTPAEIIASRRESIDADTSAKILGGFDYPINGETLHFSYDSFDQQNFADTANACLMLKSGATGLPETVTWNAYRHETGELVRLTLTADQFLELYAKGALSHKAACMEVGGVKKAELAMQEVA